MLSPIHIRLSLELSWIKSNTLPFDDTAPIIFHGVSYLDLFVCNMNSRRLDSSIQGSLGEAERLTAAIKFEVAYIPDIQLHSLYPDDHHEPCK